MELNATFFGEMITFALFVWFTMRFVWPILEETLKKRKDKITDGLQAAERGHKELELAWKYSVKQLHEAREQAAALIEHARLQAAQIVEEAKKEATREKNRIISLGQSEVERERDEAEHALKGEVVSLVVMSTEKLLQRRMTPTDHEALLDIGKL